MKLPRPFIASLVLLSGRLNTVLPESDFTFTAARGARQVEVIH
jgi:hypothetical protein